MATLQFSVAVRNALLDAIETIIGVSAILELRTGAIPANCAASRTGTVLATLALPADWMAAASSGVKAKAGTWQDASADASGTLGYWTLYATDGTTVGGQGDITATGGGGSLTVDNVVLAAAQAFTVTAWAWTAPNA